MSSVFQLITASRMRMVTLLLLAISAGGGIGWPVERFVVWGAARLRDIYSGATAR